MEFHFFIFSEVLSCLSMNKICQITTLKKEKFTYKNVFFPFWKLQHTTPGLVTSWILTFTLPLPLVHLCLKGEIYTLNICAEIKQHQIDIYCEIIPKSSNSKSSLLWFGEASRQFQMICSHNTWFFNPTKLQTPAFKILINERNTIM